MPLAIVLAANEEHQTTASAFDPATGTEKTQQQQSGATPETPQQPPPKLKADVDEQLVSKLEKLFELKKSGVLSGVEFQDQKRRLFEEV